MNRRSFIAAAATGTIAGCFGDAGSRATPTPTAETDGYPPPPAATPAEQQIDVSAFRTIAVEGQEVSLVPVDVAHYWHQRLAARFADARGAAQYERSHVRGAVLSTAPEGVEGDPIAAWPREDRIVCYCGCPHHLSSLRAASLLRAGYERVYVIDEGFWAWHDRGYPVAGSRASARPRRRTIRGRLDRAHAGETVMAVHEPSGQREAAPVATDGTYELHLRFAGVSTASVITLITPDRTVRRPLGELVAAGGAPRPRGRG